MKKTLTIGSAFLLLALMMKLMHWPGASLMIIMSCTLLSATLFLIGVSLKPKGQLNLSFILLALAILIGMFHIMNWPLFPRYRGIAIASLPFLVASIVIFFKHISHESLTANFKRTLITIHVIFVCISMTPSSSLWKFFSITNGEFAMENGSGAFVYYEYAWRLLHEGKIEESRDAYNKIIAQKGNINFNNDLVPNIQDLEDFDARVKKLDAEISRSESKN